MRLRTNVWASGLGGADSPKGTEWGSGSRSQELILKNQFGLVLGTFVVEQ